MPGGPIRFRLNDRTLTAEPGETLLQVAQRHGIDIPHLCYRDGMRPDGNCRACMVEIDGEPRLAPACCRTPETNMVVASVSPRARRAQRVVLDLLVAEATGSDAASRGELTYWSTWIAEKQKPAEAAAIQSGGSRPSGSAGNGSVQDTSHPAITVDLGAYMRYYDSFRLLYDLLVEIPGIQNTFLPVLAQEPQLSPSNVGVTPDGQNPDHDQQM